MVKKSKQIKGLVEFLQESNKIEGVYDADSLTQARLAWNYLIKQPVLTIGVILRTHKILMKNQPLKPDEKGYFRKIPVYIGRQVGEKPHLILQRLRHLLMNMNDVIKNGKGEGLTFLEYLAQIHHVEYEQIHPFIDGNGRSGRLFLNWQRLKLGLPLLIIKEDEKDEYYKWFKSDIIK